MKLEIPEQLKADVPQTTWGKILTATPVVMAVVSTMLAGLSSSEMTSAQYDRALAAQEQSKAGDQWSFFQAKRLRGAYQRSTYELLENLSGARPFRAAAFRAQLTAALEPELVGDGKAKDQWATLNDGPALTQALAALESGTPPEPGNAPVPPPQVKSALELLESSKPDTELTAAIAGTSALELDQALRQAKDYAAAFDAASKPLNSRLDGLAEFVNQRLAAAQAATSASDTNGASAAASLNRDLMAAICRYTARRYEVEARMNQAIANLYELQVRRANFTAERHHSRSERFFYGMLASQLGVIIGTFAMAARQRNLLWAMAAGAGLIAIGFAIYVYLCV